MRYVCAGLACVAAIANAAGAQIPIRTVSAPSATLAQSLGNISGIRELADGRLLVNDDGRRLLLVFDKQLATAEILADSTSGAANSYPRGARLIPYLADSTLVVNRPDAALLVIDPYGKLARIAAPPVPQHMNSLSSGQPIGTDARGRLVYQVNPAARGISVPCPAPLTPPPPGPSPDTAYIVRGDFDTRTADTIAKVRIQPFISAKLTRDGACKVTGATLMVNPVPPPIDAWTVTSDGAAVIVRGLTYQVDRIGADGTFATAPKLPFAWRRLTDNEKQAKIDSARTIIDSLTNLGGCRLQSCRGGNVTSFTTNPPRNGNDGGGLGRLGDANFTTDRVGARPAGGAVGSAAELGAALGSNDCQSFVVAPEFAAPAEMADYMPPIRGGAVLADRDGNVWIIPATSLEAKGGGLLYDVVNRNGELAERVQLPPNRTVVGFGRGGVVYLSWLDATGWHIERRTIDR